MLKQIEKEDAARKATKQEKARRTAEAQQAKQVAEESAKTGHNTETSSSTSKPNASGLGSFF